MKKKFMLAGMALSAMLAITACGGKAPAPASGTAAAESAAETVTAAAPAETAPEVKESSVAGLYRLESFLGLSGDILVEMFSAGSMDDVRNMFTFDVHEDGTAVFAADGEDPTDLTWTMEGDQITFKSLIPGDGDTLTGTVSEGVMVISIEDEEMILAREDGIEKAQAMAEERKGNSPLADIIGDLEALETEEAAGSEVQK